MTIPSYVTKWRTKH